MAETGDITLKTIYGIMFKSTLNTKSLNEHGPAKKERYLVYLLAVSYNSLTDKLLILLTLC
jgi:hypothetical protein